MIKMLRGAFCNHCRERYLEDRMGAGGGILMNVMILTPQQMNEADRLTIATGITGSWLMENAGFAILDVVLRHYPEIMRAVVLCGPGNNGGDGYVLARLLALRGVAVALYCSAPAKSGTDAEVAQSHWNGAVYPLETLNLQHGDVVIDALYGAGFRGALQDAETRAAQVVSESGVPIISVDLPSGIDGLTGQHQGPCFRADHTVTFFRKKPGHLLYPGRALCGQLHVVDIGISPRVLTEIAPKLYENSPDLFGSRLPQSDPETHKYAHDAVGIFCGGAGATGATRLSARAAAKAGAGAVIMLATIEAVPELASHLTSTMIRTIDNPECLTHCINDKKYAVFIVGPGFRDLPRLRETVLALLQSKRKLNLVFDADVFSAFASDAETLFSAIEKSTCTVVMTPHDGEFQRLFGDISQSDLAKHEMALAAAKRAFCTIIYKGPDTVIASPDGRASINSNGGTMLATAGSGDVLAGAVAGLLAQSMPAFEAACCAVYHHADTGQRLGDGLIAEQLADAIRLPTNKRNVALHNRFYDPPPSLNEFRSATLRLPKQKPGA
jgi:ADP-dependent NAD(P)H-hydrate dehydratase / NAD(P)H-hydrate epimerase